MKISLAHYGLSLYHSASETQQKTTPPVPQDFLFLAVVMAHNTSLGEQQMKKAQLISQPKSESSLLLSFSLVEHIYSAIEFSLVPMQEERQRIMKL